MPVDPPETDDERPTIPAGRDQGTGPAPDPATGRDSDPATLQPTRPTVDLDPDLRALLHRVWGESYATPVKGTETIRPSWESFETGVGRVSVPTRILSGTGKPFDPELELGSDYQLLEMIGKGGMGVVYSARQAAFDRNVAVKMIHPAKVDRIDMREKFLSEAMVTGHLDHPGIVPAIDLGMNDDGTLFFAMKQVTGTEWYQRIDVLPEVENLRILGRVADTVAFAHSKGILHRDIKPENVIIGPFGEVMVMDWGLAVNLGDGEHGETLRESNAGGGTPAYMSPEMALGDLDKVGFRSDIYLLGATLFEVVTGKPPHAFGDSDRCLDAAAQNRLVLHESSGELLDIALKAMATDPAARYADVKAFQAALAEYREHIESITLCRRAGEELLRAQTGEEYDRFSRAVFGYEESLDLWDGNARAKEGVEEARYAYASCALERGDLELAAGLLDCRHPTHQSLIERVGRAQSERDRQAARHRVLKRSLVTGVIAFVLVVMGFSGWVYRELSRRIELEHREELRLAGLRQAATEEAEDGRLALHRAGVGDPLGRERWLICAQQHFRKALFLDPTSTDGRQGLCTAALDHFRLALENRNFRQAGEKLEEARLYLADDGRYDELRAVMRNAEGARWRYIDERVAALVADCRRDQPELLAAMRRSELIALADPHTVDRLLPLLDDGDQRVRLLALGSLAWMRDERAIAPIMELTRPVRTDGRENSLPDQAAALQTLCILGRNKVEIHAAVRTRLKDEPGYLASELAHLVLPYIQVYARGALAAIEPGGKGVVPEDVAAATRRYDEALVMFEGGRYEETLPITEDLLAWEPGNPGVLDLRGLALQGLNRLVEAERCFQLAIARTPRGSELWPRVHLHRGQVLLGRGRYWRALADADRVLAIVPDHVPTLALRGSIQRYLENYEAAWTDLQRAVELDPSREAIQREQVRVLRWRGRPEEAETASAQLIERWPESAMAWAERAWSLLAVGRTVGALAAGRRAVELENTTPFILLTAAACHRAVGEVPEAVALIERAARQAVDGDLRGQAEVAYSRAHHLLATGDLSGAIEAATTARDLHPGLPRHHRLLVTLALRQGDFDLARSAVDRAAADLPELTRILELRAAVLERQEDEGRAAAFAALRKADPDRPEQGLRDRVASLARGEGVQPEWP